MMYTASRDDRLEVLTAVNMKITNSTVVWVEVPCSPAVLRLFGGRPFLRNVG
jgi:hypothetical protein